MESSRGPAPLEEEQSPQVKEARHKYLCREGLLLVAIKRYGARFTWSRRARVRCQSREQQGVWVGCGVVSRCPWKTFSFLDVNWSTCVYNRPDPHLMSSSRTALINLSHSLLRNTRRTPPPDWPVLGSGVHQAGISSARPTQGAVSCTIPRENDEIPNRSCEIPEKLVKYAYSKNS